MVESLDFMKFLNYNDLQNFTISAFIIFTIVQYTKDYKYIKNIHTKSYTLILSIIHIFVLDYVNNSLIIDNIYINIIRGFILAVVASGSYQIFFRKFNDYFKQKVDM